MIKTFATQYYAGISPDRMWHSLAFDDSLEDALESLRALYDEHCQWCDERLLQHPFWSDFRIKGLESEQEFTGE